MAGNITYLNITEEDFLNDKRPLFKHMSLENALKTLNDNELWFCKPTEWPDPFESRFLNAKYKDSTGKTSAHPWLNKVLCMCSTQIAASEAHWTPYNKEQIGIEFVIDRKSLVDYLKSYLSDYDIYIGKVEYMRTCEIKGALNKIPFAPPIPRMLYDEWWARLLLLKRNAFIYEDEIRVILVSNDQITENGKTLKYDCDNTDLIQSIILDPNLKINTENLLRSVFENDYGFKPILTKNGLHPRVYKSRLYQELNDHVYNL